MTRLATLSHWRSAISLAAVSLFALWGCGGGSGNATSSGVGGSFSVGTGGATSASIGGTGLVLTTSTAAITSGGSAGIQTTNTGGNAASATTRANGGSIATSSSGIGGVAGGTGAIGGSRTQDSIATSVASGGGHALSSTATSTPNAGTQAQGSGGIGNSSGGTRTYVSSIGGASASGGTSAGAGASNKASGGASSPTTATTTGTLPSEGCGNSNSPASGQASISVNGTSRDYVMKLPANYDPTHPYRLIFAFHGRQYTAQSVADGGPPGSGPFYGIESEAKGSAIFVAPQALSSSWTNESDRDVTFVTEMISRFESQLCIDKNRIFATGFSMGAIMTIALGCEKADVFRAIAPMSGKIQGDCSGSHGVAYWASHGTNDTTILPKDGEAARDTFAKRNGCSSQTTAGAPQGCVNYSDCDTKYPTTWCTFDGAHEPAPFAGTAIWAFLSQF